MPPAEQSILLEIPEQPRPKAKPQHGELKLKYVNRQQTMLAHICIEDLIPADHKARAIWALAERVDLTRFTEGLRTTIGCAGRPGWDAQLLVSLWVYAYSEGISSAREIERLLPWEPGMMWLSGLETICAHKLSDFRVGHKVALDELFAELLAMLDGLGLVNLEQVAHDGTKIRAQAGMDSFRREKTLRKRLEEAREVVKQMEDPQAEAAAKSRQQTARERAARERLKRLDAAAKEMAVLRAEEKKEEEKDQVRVSLTEPQARKMKHGDNAIAPSYNAQITTESEHKIIVGAHATQCSSDANSLLPALEEVAQNLGKKPQQVIVDGGFTNRENILDCAKQGIDLVGSLSDPKEKSEAAMKANGIDPHFAPHYFQIMENGLRLECPAGCSLPQLGKSVKHGNPYQQYRARGEDCLRCGFQAQCCPRKPEGGRTVSIRLEEHPAMAAFRQKMESEESKAIYRRRGEVAEFPNAWIKEKLGLRKFRMRGLVKAETELIWACLTYNVMQWVRLVWRQPVAV
jgi:transposase